MGLKDFTTYALSYYFIAFGVIIGGCIIGSVGGFLMNKPPLYEMNDLAARLKIWAIVAAIGGTFDTISDLEKGFLSGTPVEVVKHLLLIASAMIGAHTGTIIIHWLTQES